MPKKTSTYYDQAMMARVSEKIEKHDWAKAERDEIKDSCSWLLEIPDEELWDFVPPPEQIRAINVCIGHDCPICGPEITRKAGHYPWLMDRKKPFKLRCPVCDNVFPSNDFKPWNLGALAGPPASGPDPVDLGLGWLGPDGRRYYFVPYYIFWQRWMTDILGGITLLSQAFLLTGDSRYAHKCGLMLAKIASQYERFDYKNQAYHEGISGVRGRISDYIWTTGNNFALALAYDAIYPVLEGSASLHSFLRGKGLDEPRPLIEKQMLHLMVKDVMSGYVAGNMGAHQKTLCHLAIVLDNDDPSHGPTVKEMRDWLMSGPGRVEDLLWNGFWRDGLGGESSPGYSAGWCTSFYTIAGLLQKLGVDIWRQPKLKKMADIGIDLTVAGKFCPSIGDSGSVMGSGPIALAADLQGPAFTRAKDPRHAKALGWIQARPQTLWEDYFDEKELQKVLQREGTELEWETRNLGGYGLAILERGKGEHRRGLSLYYGDASGGHGHRDRLNIELFAFGRPMLPDDGYPTPFTRADFYEWRRADTVKHYCVMIDETPQRNLHAGQLNTFVSSPWVQLVDASAEPVWEGWASLYRRTTAMIDFSEEGFYLLDLFRVRGGSHHDWCFHGPPFPEFSVTGGSLGPPQEKGTLAGEEVPYGAQPPIKHGISSGFQGLFNVRRMHPHEGWSACWRNPQENLSLTLNVPAGCAQEIIAAEGEAERIPGSPKTIQYVIGRNRLGEGPGALPEKLFSKFAAVIEPHRGPAAVKGVQPLKSQGAGAETAGLCVDRGGEKDWIHSSLSAGERVQWEGPGGTWRVAAEFALITLDAKGVKRAVLINGTLMEFGDLSLRSSPAPDGRVLRVDPAANRITIDASLPSPESFRGRVILIGNERHWTSYTIMEAKGEGGTTTLSFGDVLFLVGMGEVAGSGPARGTLISRNPLTGRARTDGGRHAGRWLYNEDKTRCFRISAVTENEIQLEGMEGDLDAVFGDADGDGRRRYWISDIGPGDRYRIPQAIWLGD